MPPKPALIVKDILDDNSVEIAENVGSEGGEVEKEFSQKELP